MRKMYYWYFKLFNNIKSWGCTPTSKLTLAVSLCVIVGLLIGAGIGICLFI